MSEERRKRRQERLGKAEATAPTKSRTWVWIVAVLVVALAYTAYWYHSNHRYDEFARCLTAKHAKMYGLYWCPHCADQKAMFGKAFQYVPYVECAVKGSHDLTPECTEAGVKLFPAWQFGENKPIEGVFPLEELSDKTGCSLP